MKYFVSILLIFISTIAYQQTIQFTPTDTLKGKFDRFSVDNFGKIYVVDADVIRVFDANLDTLFTASLKALRPASIETSKSFRTLLFDDDRSVIQFLDNTGTAIQDEIDLVLLDIQQPILVCESFAGNTIWILDADNMRLVKINQKLEKVLITENLRNVFDGDQWPIQMKEANDYLFVNIPGKGVAKFDVFGTFVSLYPIEADWIDARGNYLFVKSGSELQIIPADGLLEPEYAYKMDKGVQQFIYTRSKVYLLYENQLVIGNYTKSE